MRTIGIRELKAHLSSALRDVQRGETFLVTDRGRVVAELRAPGAVVSAGTPSEQAILRLASQRHLRVGEGRPDYSRSPIRRQAGLAQELIDADRGE